MCEYKPCLTLDQINPNVVNAQYAVRGAVPARANEIELDLKKGGKYPFDHVVYCNIGNPQRLGQVPITFYRQVASLALYPDLMKYPKIEEIYPKDVIERTKNLLSRVPGGIGAYSNSQGIIPVLEDVAEFIAKRDGYPCDYKSVFLTQGASPGIQHVLQLLIRSPIDGVLTPTPQYPLYTGTLALLGGRAVPYFLDEKAGWALSVDAMRSAVKDARKVGINVRAMVVINPGNPTGACITEDNILSILRFAYAEHMVVLADEVYQFNIYKPETTPFVSFRKVYKKHADELKGLELFSFNSISKGFMGECGLRGGYMQAENLNPEAHAQLLKLASLSLCPNVLGQVVVGLMVNPPKEGEPSYELYQKETQGILASLQRRAQRLSEKLDKLPCCSCQTVVSAMYAFPNLVLPPKACEAAKAKGMEPDVFYSFSLLESTGLCVVPGSGFRQVEGTYHIRTTILPSEAEFDEVIEKFGKHHIEFINKYADKAWIEEQEKIKAQERKQ